jgi:Big-like domain-containing protein
MSAARRRSAILLSASLSIGCGSPSSPTPIHPASLVIQLPSSTVLVGSTVTPSVLALASDGTTSTVTSGVRWVTDAPSVLSVSTTGVVTGLASGRATVFATYQEMSSAIALRVIPVAAGTWRGAGHVTLCTGFFDERTCSRLVPTGSSGALTVTLTQSGDSVSGTIELITTPPPVFALSAPLRFSGPLDGTILDDGTLRAASDAISSQPVSGGSASCCSGIVNWRTKETAARTTGGTFTQAFLNGDAFGAVYVGRVEWTIDQLSR